MFNFTEIGIDLGSESIKLAIVEKTGRSVNAKKQSRSKAINKPGSLNKLTKSKTYEVNSKLYSPEYFQTLKTAIKEFAKENKLSRVSLNIAVSLDKENSYINFIDMPVVGEKFMEDGVKFEAEQNMSIEGIEGSNFTWKVLDENIDTGEYKILLAYLKKEVVRALAQFKTIKWRVNRVILQPLVLERLVEENDIIIDMGHKNTRVYAYEKGKIDQVELIELGGEELIKDIQSYLDMNLIKDIDSKDILKHIPIYNKRLEDLIAKSVDSEMTEVPNENKDLFLDNSEQVFTEDYSSKVEDDSTPIFLDEDSTEDESIPMIIDEDLPEDKTYPILSDEDLTEDKHLSMFIDEDEPEDKTYPIFLDEELPKDSELPMFTDEDEPEVESNQPMFLDEVRDTPREKVDQDDSVNFASNYVDELMKDTDSDDSQEDSDESSEDVIIYDVNLIKELSKLLSPKIELMIFEIKRIIRMYELQNTINVDKVYYVGQLSQMQLLKETIESELDMDLSPLSFLDISRDDEIAYSLASLVSMDTDLKDQTNFSKHIKANVDYTSLIVILLMVALSTGFAFKTIIDNYTEQFSEMQGTEATQNQTISSLNSESSTLEETITNKKKFISRMDDLKNQKKWLSDILFIVPDRTPTTVVIHNINVENEKVLIEGLSSDYSSIGFFANKLKDTATVSIDSIEKYGEGGDVYSVTLENPELISDKYKMTQSFTMTLTYKGPLLNH